MNTENKEIEGMVFNKATLAFPEKNETLFLKKYFSDSLIQFRVAFLLVTVLYAAFGYLDTRMVPQYAELFQIIRFYFVVPLLSLVLVLSFTDFFSKIWQVLLFISFIAAGVGISLMTMLAPYNYGYYAGMMLIFSAGYFFIKLRFFLASIAGWTTLLIFNIGAVFFAHSSNIIIINNNFFYISANLIGMFAAYNIEYYARRDFFMNQQVDRQKAVVIETNKSLEIKVEERTKQLKEAKEKAEQSDNLKSTFLANMSHEIRTPMNGILGFAKLMKEPDLSGEDQNKYLRIIEESGIRLLNIINNIIDISKIEAGLMEIYLQQSNINDQIEYIYSFFKPEVEKKGIKLYYNNSLPSNESIITTDKEKIYAILTNVVKNAIKYTKFGSIELGYNLKPVNRATAQGQGAADNVSGVGGPAELEFFVKDTGIGIAKNRQEAIFERFIQADIYDKQAYQGAGLGLTIAKAYVEMLGGKIWVESEEGKGSNFYFTIPYNIDPEPKITITNIISRTREKNQISNLKVLIAEDDEISNALIDTAIKKISDKVFHSKTGIEAVKICSNNPDIDLVLMDIRMPDMNGYEATRQIREFNKNVIIIAQTAHGLSGDRKKAIDAGCNDYISKPMDKDELLGLIQLYLGK